MQGIHVAQNGPPWNYPHAVGRQGYESNKLALGLSDRPDKEPRVGLEWLEELNPAQREAVTHGDGPLLVVAGAGTGKTKTLASRVAYLIEKGCPADRILLLTFTRRAAAEMISRANRLCARSQAAQVWGGTFHATANRLLRIYGRAIGLSPDFTVMDESDAAEMMGIVRNDLGLGRQGERFARKETLATIYSRMVNSQKPLESVVAKQFPWCHAWIDDMRQVFDGYAARKRENEVLDYDDLLLMWSALCSAGEVGRTISDRFEHVLVDEYQDTNIVQSDILRALRKDRPNIMIVGDDAQSIYSFRAATVHNMLDFADHFHGAKIVKLEENYRSTQPILNASNAVMAGAKRRFTKNLHSTRTGGGRPVLVSCYDEPQQTQAVADRVLRHAEDGIALMRQAVLFRTGHHSAALEIELARRRIPFRKYGGLKFIDAAHIKDMIAFLRILENPHDEISWHRILKLLPGVGPVAAGKIVARLGVRRREATPALDAGSPLSRLVLEPIPVPSAAREDFERIRRTMADCLGAPATSASARERPDEAQDEPLPGEPPLAVQVERIRQCYQPLFENRYEDSKIRLRDLEQLELIASGYKSRRRFVTDLTLDPPTGSTHVVPPHLEEDFLVLSTIHSAKGCEWDVVHIIHAADGNIPSDMAAGDEASLDEERRLLYVAMTRAKDFLYVYHPLRYFRKLGKGDPSHIANLSRFITPDVRNCLDQTSPIEDILREDQRRLEDVHEKTRSLWQGRQLPSGAASDSGE
jgi:DNA helicase-2/ATP-dependent DNA helicase PcrA